MGDNVALTYAEREASRWLVRLESQDVTLDDHKSFRAWLNASSEHRTAFEAISATWDRLDNLKHLARKPSTAKPGRRMLIFAGAGVASAAAAAMFLVPALGPLGATSYATGVGERETFTLADGSTAELNAGTRMRVRYSADEREIFLDEGEALFDVEADPTRPFLVRTEFGAIRVLGTSFVVKVGVDNMRATVLRGTVEGQAATTAGISALLSRSGAAVIATANQEISFRQTGVARTDLAPQAAARRVAWRDGMIAFDGETLREAAAEVERQTGVRFAFADPALEQVRVGGYISASDPNAFVQLLEENFAISAERRSNGTVILRTPE